MLPTGAISWPTVNISGFSEIKCQQIPMTVVLADRACKQTIDARGFSCPLPLLKAKQGLNNLAPGERLQVLATDAGSVRDFHTFAALSCHYLESFEERDGVYYYIFVKGVEPGK